MDRRDVFEEPVDSIGCCSCELLLEIRRAMIDAGVEAKRLHGIAALVSAARNPHDARAGHFGQLPATVPTAPVAAETT